MAEVPYPRLRVQYLKEGRLAFLGHLEVLHTIDRSVRRSGVPFAVGNGFARHMKIQFCQALPVGASSRAEYFDLRLRERLEPEEALWKLCEATPRDLRPVRAHYVSPTLPALEAWLDIQTWVVALDRELPVDAAALAGAVGCLRAERELHFMRGDKPRTVFLDETLVSFAASEQEGRVVLDLTTRATGKGALRPHILLDAAFERLGLPRTYARVTRLSQAHADGAALVEPFDPSCQIALT